MGWGSHRMRKQDRAGEWREKELIGVYECYPDEMGEEDSQVFSILV